MIGGKPTRAARAPRSSRREHRGQGRPKGRREQRGRGRPKRRTASFNKLSPSQAESLALLLEELGEAQQAIGKILRHGLRTSHPATGVVNRDALEHELGDVRAAVLIACGIRLCREDRIGAWCRSKLGKVRQYLHHVDVPATLRYPRHPPVAR